MGRADCVYRRGAAAYRDVSGAALNSGCRSLRWPWRSSKCARRGLNSPHHSGSGGITRMGCFISIMAALRRFEIETGDRRPAARADVIDEIGPGLLKLPTGCGRVVITALASCYSELFKIVPR